MYDGSSDKRIQGLAKGFEVAPLFCIVYQYLLILGILKALTWIDKVYKIVAIWAFPIILTSSLSENITVINIMPNPG